MTAVRTYLVIVDDTPEASVALRFAARRAAKTGGSVEVLAIVPPADFVAFGGVQATIEDEARAHAETLVRTAAGQIVEEAGVRPLVRVKSGDPVAAIAEAVAENQAIDALVLGAAKDGPGPLVEHFATHAGRFPVPVMIVPGCLDVAALDRLS